MFWQNVNLRIKLNSLLAFAIFMSPVAFAQGPAQESAQPPVSESAPGAFRITKITKNLITAPQFSYGGAERYATDQHDRWLEVEAEFTAAPQFTDELTFKYFVLFNGQLLTGEVTHMNILGGRERRSVMYVPPNALAYFSNNRQITIVSCQNIAVQVVQRGAVKDEASLQRAAPQWFAAIQQIPGFLLNKNQTPFAPLFWDRYEQIKTER
jgi:hypothetical protein